MRQHISNGPVPVLPVTISSLSGQTVVDAAVDANVGGGVGRDVGGGVGGNVGAAVGDAVGGGVGGDVGAAVGDAVGGGVGGNVGAGVGPAVAGAHTFPTRAVPGGHSQHFVTPPPPNRIDCLGFAGVPTHVSPTL